MCLPQMLLRSGDTVSTIKRCREYFWIAAGRVNGLGKSEISRNEEKKTHFDIH